jgi:hypothetical protein
MNDLVKANETGLTAYDNPYEAEAAESGANIIQGDLLKFSGKDGRWTRGQDGKDVSGGTEFVCDVENTLVGWQRWQDNRPTDVQIGRVADGYKPAQRNAIGDTDKDEWETDDQGQPRDPWQPIRVLYFADAKGDVLTYSASSKGGRDAIVKMLGTYGKALRESRAAGKTLGKPVVRIDTGFYMHPDKKRGKIYTPSLDIIGYEGETAPALEAPAKKTKTVF